MNVLFVVAEITPLAKVGGLADVAAGLPRALRRLGHDVRVIMPYYTSIQPAVFPTRSTGVRFQAPSDRGLESCEVYEGESNGVPLYLVRDERLLNRSRVYGYQDDLDRFVFFSRAAVEAVRHLEWPPDVLHTHDWHTGIICAWAHLGAADGPIYQDAATVFTIHNLSFQGWFDDSFRRRFDLVPEVTVAEPIAGVDLHSMVALAVNYADAVNTVSETYAREILTPEFGEGIDALLRFRSDRLRGIVNGIDYDVFNPQTDPHIEARYGTEDPRNKLLDKLALQREAGLARDPSALLIGMVSRLTDQKGLDLVAAALPSLMEERPVQLVVLGSGEERYHRLFEDLTRRFPARVAAYLTFDAALAERIYAGADLFLMPSRFEPCGLGQLIALRYGTVPLVRETGGLADTVEDFREDGRGTGFVFREYSAQALRGALLRAMDVFSHPEIWAALLRRGLASDVSWDASAMRYEQLYRDAIDLHGRERDRSASAGPG